MRDIQTIRNAKQAIFDESMAVCKLAKSAADRKESEEAATLYHLVDRLDAFNDALSWVLGEKIEYFPTMVEGLLGDGEQTAKCDVERGEN